MATIEERLAALEKAQEPKEPFKSKHPHVPFDPTAKMGLPPSAVREMVKAVPDRMVRDIVRTASRPVQLPSVPGESCGKPGSNFTEPMSLTVPGVDLCDRLVDSQDAVDRRELQRRTGIK
jgi:hypothetical protein